MGSILRTGVLVAMVGLVPWTAAAQSAPEQTLLQAHIGQGWFLDESAIRHDVVGIGVSRRASSRIWLKADLTHMRGPGSDRDWLLLGHVSFDVLADRHAAVPYFALGAGATRYTNSYFGRDTEEYGPVIMLTAGVRIRVGDRWFVAPEIASGAGPQTRLGITFGVRK